MSITRSDVIATVAIGISGYLAWRLKKLGDKYEQAIDTIANDIDVNVDNEIINEAVKKAVDRETASQVDTACQRAIRLVQDDIAHEVRKAVDTEKDHIKEDTKKAIEKKLDNIDISEARKEVISDAQKMVADKLEEDTRVIKNTYEASIKNVAKMCEEMISSATVSANKVREPINVDDVKTVINLFKEVR